MIKADVKKLRSAQAVGYKRAEKRLSFREDSREDVRRNLDILELARCYYDSMYDLRKRRLRNRKFYRGDQWSDFVTVNGKVMREEEYIKLQGKPALKQNMIRPPVRNVIGQYRSNPYKPVVFARNRQNQKAAEMMSVALESALFMNDCKERDARMIEEFLLSGTAVYKVGYAYDDERVRPIPKFRAVNPNRFFINTDMEDVCGDDVNFIGEVSDLTMNDLVANYGRSVSEERLRRVYSSVREYYTTFPGFSSGKMDSIDLLVPSNQNRCRVIEVWRLEAEWRLLVHDYMDASYEVRPVKDEAGIMAENKERLRLGVENGIDVPLIEYERRYVKYWKCYHLSPLGDTLFESETPYEHNGHPYVFKLYPMLDGEIWGMVEDLIDQQKMVNRNMILYDFIISSSAKGVLLVPEECIPDDMTIEDFADEWVKYNGVIKIKLKAGMTAPQQVSANSINIGITEMIQMQLKLMQEISGVEGAIQGKSPNAGTSGARYAQETQNAALNILDYLETFSSFLQKRDRKILQVIKQFYTEKQYITVAGSDYSEEAKHYDPDEIRNVDFDNSISKGNDTPTYRMVIDDMLWKLLEGQFISAEMFLEHCSYPFSDKILQSMKKMREQMQQGEMPEGMPQDLLRQMQQEAGRMSPEQEEQIQKMMSGGYRKGE